MDISVYRSRIGKVAVWAMLNYLCLCVSVAVDRPAATDSSESGPWWPDNAPRALDGGGVAAAEWPETHPVRHSLMGWKRRPIHRARAGPLATEKAVSQAPDRPVDGTADRPAHAS